MSKERLDLLIWDLGKHRRDIVDFKESISYFKNDLMNAEEEVETIIKEILEIQEDILEEEKMRVSKIQK